jgi:hypothetical protein
VVAGLRIPPGRLKRVSRGLLRFANYRFQRCQRTPAIKLYIFEQGTFFSICFFAIGEADSCQPFEHKRLRRDGVLSILKNKDIIIEDMRKRGPLVSHVNIPFQTVIHSFMTNMLLYFILFTQPSLLAEDC